VVGATSSEGFLSFWRLFSFLYGNLYGMITVLRCKSVRHILHSTPNSGATLPAYPRISRSFLARQRTALFSFVKVCEVLTNTMQQWNLPLQCRSQHTARCHYHWSYDYI